MGEAQPPVYDPGHDWKTGIQSVPQQTHTYGAPATSGASGGAGFKYDEATLHELVKQWSDMAKDFQDDLAQAEVLARAQGPGREYASGGNAELIRASGNALSDTLRQRTRYCQAMADKYVTALGKYATDEEHHVSDISQQTGGSL